MRSDSTTPHFIDLELKADGWIKKYVLHYELPDGTRYEYDSASRKGPDAYRAELEANGRGETPRADAVCVVPQTRDGRLVLIKEFRYPLNSWCIAFPAGLIDPGEDPAESIDRELREETGFALRRDLDEPLELLPQVGYSSAGFTDETIQVAFAQVEKVADAAPEEAELIVPFEVAIDDIPRFLSENTIPISTRAQLILDGFARHRDRNA